MAHPHYVPIGGAAHNIMTDTELRAAWAAEKRQPGALAAYLAVSRDAWAATLAAAPDRTKVLKWIARVRADAGAAAVLRWQHEISPLTRDEIRGAGLVAAFVRKCDVGTLRWLEEVTGPPEFKLTHAVMRAVTAHEGPAALATTEWIIAHTEADGPVQKELRSALYGAVVAGNVPLARRLREFEDRPDCDYQHSAITSQSLEMVRLINEWEPLSWATLEIFHVGEHATPEVAAFIMEQTGDEAFRARARDILYWALTKGTVELAVWLRETFPARCTEEAIRHLAPEGEFLEITALLRSVLERSDPRPIMEWLEEVCVLVPADFGDHPAESIVRGEKSIETLCWCLDRYGGANIRETPGLVTGAGRLSNKNKAFKQAEWLVTTYRPLAACLWNYGMFWALSRRTDRLAIARKFHALIPLTAEDLLASNGLRYIYSTRDCAFIRWIHHVTGVTLDDARARHTQLLGRSTRGTQEEQYIQYIDFIGELGGLTLADWKTTNLETVVMAAQHGWARVLVRARDAGVTQADIRPYLTDCVSSLSRTLAGLSALTEVFNFSCREIRRAALRKRWITKKDVEHLMSEYGATIEDLRENDHEVLRGHVAQVCGAKTLKALSLLGIVAADALAVMDSLGRQPERGTWSYSRWNSTRRELRRLTRT